MRQLYLRTAPKGRRFVKTGRIIRRIAEIGMVNGQVRVGDDGGQVGLPTMKLVNQTGDAESEVMVRYF